MKGAIRALGRFELIEQLSAGGMGEIYLARVLGPYHFEKHFILKLMKAEFADDPKDLQRFAREAKIAAQLTHPNVVQVFDFGSSEGRYFIAMEYVDGLNLTRLMRGLIDQKLLFPYHICAYLVAEIARALNYMHNYRSSDGEKIEILHRDVSPENILVSRDGAVKLSDFGLVQYSGAEKLTNVGKVRGKLCYMAPERALGELATTGSDQFSLGMVLHELLVGRRYFPANMEKSEIQDSLLNQGILPPVTFREEIPAVLNEIVRRSTSRDPSQRFSSIFEMENALRDFMLKDAVHRKQLLHPGEEILQLVRMVQAHKANKADKKLSPALKDVLQPFCRTLNSCTNVSTALAFGNPPESELSLATRILRFLRQRLSLT